MIEVSDGKFDGGDKNILATLKHLSAAGEKIFGFDITVPYDF